MLVFVFRRVLSVFAILVVISNISALTSKRIWNSDVYPRLIPKYSVRKDTYENINVSRGRFQLLFGDPQVLRNDPVKKVSLSTLKKTLQCSEDEPSINGNRGIIDMLKMIPPSKTTVERVCAFVETQCDWNSCGDVIEEKRSHEDDKTSCRPVSHERNLVRIINGEIYTDWPWCVDTQDDTVNSDPYPSMTILMAHVLDLVNDIKDSVFLVGAEQPYLPWNVPFPMLSCSPEIHKADIPLPWYESLKTEFELYRKAAIQNDFSFDTYSKPFVPHSVSWNERIEKAAYFGEMISIRQIFFTQALLRPDLIEARWTCGFCSVSPWNPTADKEIFTNYFKINGDTKPPIKYSVNQTTNMKINPNEVGYLKDLQYIHISEPAHLAIGHFKYLVVLTGVEGKAASGRLASYLAYSGAVVLLQMSEFEYHFSARLKPWVHYVPLTYSAADIVAKVEWLKAHDMEAQQIAENARNFGLSYLRLEDQYCYVATLLETLAEVVNGTDAGSAFNPVKITV